MELNLIWIESYRWEPEQQWLGQGQLYGQD